MNLFGLKLQSVEMLIGTFQHKDSIFNNFKKIKYIFSQASSDPLIYYHALGILRKEGSS